jgi:hypothetical protein
MFISIVEHLFDPGLELLYRPDGNGCAPSLTIGATYSRSLDTTGTPDANASGTVLSSPSARLGNTSTPPARYTATISS